MCSNVTVNVMVSECGGEVEAYGLPPTQSLLA